MAVTYLIVTSKRAFGVYNQVCSRCKSANKRPVSLSGAVQASAVSG